MRKINFLWVTGMLMIISVHFISCSDDSPGSKSDLIGVWELEYAIGWDKENGKIIEEWTDYYPEQLEFYDDGICRWGYNGKWESNFWDWNYKKGKLNMWDDDDDQLDFTVKSLSSSKLVLEEYYKSREEGILYEYNVTSTYYKISD